MVGIVKSLFALMPILMGANSFAYAPEVTPAIRLKTRPRATVSTNKPWRRSEAESDVPFGSSKIAYRVLVGPLSA